MDKLALALEELAAKFRDRCERERVELLGLIETGQLRAPRVRQLVHGLAGAGGTFGFPKVSARGRKAEQALEGGHAALPELNALLAELERATMSAPNPGVRRTG